MSLESNPEIAKLRPFLVLAREYEPFFPVCAFYLKQFCSNSLMELYKSFKAEGKDDPIIKRTLNEWIGDIEQAKQKYGAQLANKEENLKEIESFTLNVFIKADDEYRGNTFTGETVKALNACAKLFEVLNYLGVPSEDFAEKRKYAKAKALEIFKRLKNPELFAPKEEPSKPHDEETKMGDEGNRNMVHQTPEIKNSVGFMNKSVKNQVFQEEGDSDRESVERMLAFAQSHKQELAKFGFVAEKQQEPVPKNNNFQSKIPQNSNDFHSKLPTNNNNNNYGNQQKNNDNLKPQPPKSRELMSTIANQKMSMVAIKDRAQKECQSAIVDITSNRINQAKLDIENALNYLRELK